MAIGLLTQRSLDRLGGSLEMVWKVDETPCFGALLHAINVAYREVWRERDRQSREQEHIRETNLMCS